ncbi:metalloprotease [Spiromyces aspiralis]|uniref:Metalloprotease n=1 Tax=Spiromyces aspiralis TaxID=68401 RepID=A0ACC1HRX0_9FUNG|nr:metalloprotease [Spiromyces aspiralis]
MLQALPSGEPFYIYVGAPIELPGADTRPCRLLRLMKNIEVMQVHDASHSTAAAASMLVKVGMDQDTPESPGMAHFCEHMLFTSSEKCLAVNGLRVYLTTHSGYSNACTSRDHTQYYFSAESSGLEGALDRWSQLFVRPFFDPSYVRCEVKTVDSEFKIRLDDDDDDYCFYALLSELSDSAHPHAKFDIGSYDTLAIGAKQMAIKGSAEVCELDDRGVGEIVYRTPDDDYVLEDYVGYRKTLEMSKPLVYDDSKNQPNYSDDDIQRILGE